MLPKNPLSPSALHINAPVWCGWQMLPFANDPQNERYSNLKQSTDHPISRTQFRFSQTKPCPGFSFDSGSSSIPLGLVSFKMALFPSIWPWSISLAFAHPITCVHKLDLLGVNNPAQPPLSSTNTYVSTCLSTIVSFHRQSIKENTQWFSGSFLKVYHILHEPLPAFISLGGSVTHLRPPHSFPGACLPFLHRTFWMPCESSSSLLSPSCILRYSVSSALTPASRWAWIALLFLSLGISMLASIPAWFSSTDPTEVWHSIQAKRFMSKDKTWWIAGCVVQPGIAVGVRGRRRVSTLMDHFFPSPAILSLECWLFNRCRGSQNVVPGPAAWASPC